MTGIERAIELGFWPRLMGYISAARNPVSARVAELAADQSTGVRLSSAEAGQLLDIGLRSRSAASIWLGGGALAAGAVPQANLPASAGLDGGEPGPHEVGIIARIKPGLDLPINFSADAVETPFQRIVNDLEEFLSVICGGDSDKRRRCLSDQEEVRKVLDNWLTGNRTAILPNYIVLRTGG